MTLRDHNFHCPTCGEQGIIGLPDKFSTFGCPANCGATFAKYQGTAGWHIRCVVRPMFKRVADGETASKED